MKRAATHFTLLICLATATVLLGQAPTQPPGSIWARLAGEWTGTGVILKDSVGVELSVASRLGGRVHELRWTNLGTTPARRFEGLAIYSQGADGGWVGRWWDSAGGEHALVPSESANALEVLWGDRGKTVYTLAAANTLEVVDSVKGTDGAFREFGRSTLVRKAV